MSVNRTDRILALAWSLPDALAVLRSKTGETRRLAPTAWQLCAPCDGSGELRDRFGRPEKCSTCGGAGRYRTDPYADGQPVSSADDLASARSMVRRVMCDRCGGGGVVPARWFNPGKSGLVACPSCDGSGRVDVPVDGGDQQQSAAAADTVTWAIRGGDWGALDAALERMRANGRRPLWRAFVAAYVEPPYQVTGQARSGLEQVERMMPARVRVPAEVLVAWQQRDQRARDAAAARARRVGRDHRNREIRAALRLGHSTQEVARMFAVSDRTVRRLA